MNNGSQKSFLMSYARRTMDSIEKLVLGTANFGQEYNGILVPLSEIKKILKYAKKVGIEYLDCAVAYNYELPVFYQLYKSGFKSINKIIAVHDSLGSYATLIHHIEDIPKLWPVLWDKKFCRLETMSDVPKIGISVYNLSDINCLPYDIIQLPYKNCKDGLPELKKRGIEIHVRKVFADKCFEDALADKNVDRIVIGVNSLSQLKENVKIAEGIK